jgi:MATE family multidrug resistance protein
VVVNAVADYALIFGNFGLPRMEIAGSGLSTSLVNWIMLSLTFAYVLRHRRYRRYHLLARFWRADWSRLRELARIGGPIGLMVTAEVGIFSVAAVMMGWLGTAQLAAHAVAMQFASIAFMVPLGLSQATTVRVGLAYGRRSPEGVRKAGWTSLVLALLFMSTTSLLFVTLRRPLVGLFLDPADPANGAAIGFAAAYLGVAGLFQLFDGTQVVMAAALRGLSDTAMPLVVAIIGYWGVGLPIAYIAGFVLHFGGTGLWVGLAAGLSFVAIVLTIRFSLRDRLGLIGDMTT